MTARVLRTELRRSAFWVTAISILVTFSPQAADGMTVVVGSQRQNVTLLPVALAVGAWQARRDRRSRTTELLATTSRPPWQRLLLTAAALAAGALAGYAVTFAGITGYAAAVGAYVPAGAFAAAAVTALYLMTAIWLGLAIGRMWPYVLVPPLLFVGGSVAAFFLLLAADLEGYVDELPPGTVLLNPFQKEGFLYAQALTARAQLAQASWALALATAGLLLFAASRRYRLAAALPVVVGAAVAGALLPSHVPDAVVLDRGAVALYCTPDDPRICTRRVHSRFLDDLRGPGRQALAILSARLPQAPTTVVESPTVHGTGFLKVGSPQPDKDILYAEIIPDSAVRTDRDRVWALLMGAGTLDSTRFPPGTPIGVVDRHAIARLVAAAWLLGEEPRAVPAEDWGWLAELPATAPAYQAFRALPAAEQRARVAALRAAELACASGDRLEILTADGRP